MNSLHVSFMSYRDIIKTAYLLWVTGTLTSLLIVDEFTINCQIMHF